MGKITEEQLNNIVTLKCERLSSGNNAELVLRFENTYNDNNLCDALDNRTDEEQKGNMVYYLVKTDKEIPLMFFTLRCGLVYDPMLTDEEISYSEKLCNDYFFTKDGYSEEIKRIMDEKQFTENELKEYMGQLHNRIRNQRKRSNAVKESNYKENKHIHHVQETFPAIEIVHICKNEAANFDWSTMGMPSHKLGEIVFFYKILPIVKRISQNVGVRYIYLYAADKDEDGELVNYYAKRLNFDKDSYLCSCQPEYDYCCRFMCQELESAMDFKINLDKHFNPDAEVE